MSQLSIPLRLKRMRRTASIRALLREHHLRAEQLVAPLFINANITERKPISSMPGQYQLSLHNLADEILQLNQLGIKAVLLFGIPLKKDARGSDSLHDQGIIQQAIKQIKKVDENMLVIADVCFCEYTDHGHCGILKGNALDNDATLAQLAAQAVSYAKAGADWVAPSSMTDGMVQAIRQALDTAGFIDVAILSYAVKYRSSFYAPFREAAQGAPQFSDRQTYQMDPANSAEALREAELDLKEGADILMVKPAMNYLDIIYRLKHSLPAIPLCAYQVSGEYAMIKAAVKQGYLEEEAAMIESLIAIKRAGADFIISYFAKDMAYLLLNKPLTNQC